MAYRSFLDLPGGDYEAVFRIKALGNVSAPLCRLDISASGFEYIAVKTVGPNDIKPGQWVEITLPFAIDPKGATGVGPRVYYMGQTGVAVDWISVRMGDTAWLSLLQ